MRGLERAFGIGRKETRELLGRAEEIRPPVVKLSDVTDVLARSYDLEQRKQILALVWTGHRGGRDGRALGGGLRRARDAGTRADRGARGGGARRGASLTAPPAFSPHTVLASRVPFPAQWRVPRRRLPCRSSPTSSFPSCCSRRSPPRPRNLAPGPLRPGRAEDRSGRGAALLRGERSRSRRARWASCMRAIASCRWMRRGARRAATSRSCSAVGCSRRRAEPHDRAAPRGASASVAALSPTELALLPRPMPTA